MGRFAYIWEYTVKEVHRQDFLDTYGPGGDWVRLFSSDSQYIETILYHDANQPNRFVTTDYWTSQQARDDFRLRHATQFKRLDDLCEAYTESETLIGDFHEISG